MDRKERTEQNMQELFHSHAAGDEGTDAAFLQILQGNIFGDVCYTGSLDNRMRELVTVTVLTTLSALPQLKAHVQASLTAPILSIKNPLTGSRITVPQVGEIIRDIPGADGEVLVENP